MAYTVLAVYPLFDQAEGALDELLSLGYARHKLCLGPAADTPAAREAALQGREQSDDLSIHQATLPESLRAQLGQHADQGDAYLEAVRRGSYVLMANADNDQEADHAMSVMARHRPVNIDAVSARWRRQGWSRYDPAAPAMTQEEVELERSAITDEKPALPAEQMQVPRDEAQRLGVRLFQRGAAHFL
jgi:hypothetical protein